MDAKTVYIETSFVSYLAGRASRDLLIAAGQQATRDWWEGHRQKYELYTSQLVVAESSAGEPEAVRRRLAYLEGISELPLTGEVRSLARALVAKGALPPRAEADALHIAIAAVHRIDLLLTWNCRHIDNPILKPVVRGLCLATGFTCPEICTPMEILEV